MRNAQLILAMGLAVSGLVLLAASFIVAPTGEIHPSVLAAIGEVFTFSGSILGIDYRYRSASSAAISSPKGE